MKLIVVLITLAIHRAIFPLCHIKHFRRNISSKMRDFNDRKGKGIFFIRKIQGELDAFCIDEKVQK